PGPQPQRPPLQAVATIPGPQPPSDEKARLLPLIQALEQTRGNRAIVYWLTPQARISDGSVVPMFDLLTAMGKQPAIDLVLYTTGGDVEIPWRLVSLLREFCAKLG